MKETCEYCFELTRNCVCVWVQCDECRRRIPTSEASEYRGRVFCEAHDFDEQVEKREYERAEVVAELRQQTKPLEGLSFGDSVVGRANREILKGAIEIAKKEPARTRLYERGKL